MKDNRKGVIALLATFGVILVVLGTLFVTGIIDLSNEGKASNNQNNNTNSQGGTNTTVCTSEASDKLEILSMENKTEKIRAIGGGTKGYNVITTVTKEHKYTGALENDELYTIDYSGTLFILYKNRVYYTSQKETVSKYCTTNEVTGSTKSICDYSKFSENDIKEFNTISIDLNLKAIGSFSGSGSGALILYAITTDGKVIKITEDSSNNYNGCEIMYENSEYPIDRIFNLNFYDGLEYTILLKNGALITRNVDREHPIELGSE